MISIHAPCTGSDPSAVRGNPPTMKFQSTLPARGATRRPDDELAQTILFQSTLPARGATRGTGVRCRKSLISIHAPCTGSDVIALTSQNVKGISIHAPCTGSDRRRRAYDRCKRYFNPRSLHGERRFFHRFTPFCLIYFNPRSLHGERHALSGCASYFSNFNPRSLHGERHKIPLYRLLPATISIHAPCTGSDGLWLPGRVHPCHFNPRSLHGERRRRAGRTPELCHFNPRSLHGERRRVKLNVRFCDIISIHAPCTGSDRLLCLCFANINHFNPRSLHGERRTALCGCSPCGRYFNPRSLHG